ncbi:MAG: hypothetical protein ABIO98_02545 [Chitinophagales bacterium]
MNCRDGGTNYGGKFRDSKVRYHYQEFWQYKYAELLQLLLKPQNKHQDSLQEDLKLFGEIKDTIDEFFPHLAR